MAVDKSHCGASRRAALVWAGLAMLLGATPGVSAQQPGQQAATGQGIYMPVGRMNDPFVFCSEGMPMHGWVAVNPVSGTWTPISQYVNYQWIPTYVAICPRAMGQGAWQGPGTGSTTPFVH